MSYWFDYLVEKERREQEAAQAEAHRRARDVLQATMPPGPKRRLRARLFAYLGRRLVDWGLRLQNRSGEIVIATASLVQEPFIEPPRKRQCQCQ
ncbi:MAG: hypothetical protein ACOC8X_07385 [Chloroflexota bacterium]